MNISVTGTIEKKDFGLGTWALVTESNETYELYQPTPELQKNQIKVKIEGIIRDDIMTLAMIGAVLEVKSFEILG